MLNQKQQIINIILIISIVIIGNNHFSKKNIKNDDKINYILNTIATNYVDSIDMPSLIESSIEQTLKNLDPHSIYMNSDQVQSSMEMMQGSFEGIGVEFSIYKDTIVVINVIPNGPSEKEGLKAGERIISIEYNNVAGIDIKNEDVIKKLRGKGGSQVTIGVYSPGSKTIRNITITRSEIPLKSLDVGYEISPGIGYIKLNRFSETTFTEFKSELNRLLVLKKIKSLILDLRGNSGGYLDQAINILNEFFEKDKLLVYTKGNFRPEQKYFSSKAGDFKEGEVCILIDNGSASASEIIAGAIQDHHRGTIIGERSFGKGLVQEQIPLSDGSLIRLTVARYHTPSGRCIQKPYSGDENDLNNLYFEQSFISVDTLQKFTTDQGKVVYGGGGISPDYTVKHSETILPPSLIYLYSSDFFNNLVFDYVDSKRKKMIQANYTNWKISENEQLFMLSKIKNWMTLELKDNYDLEQLDLEINNNTDNITERLSALIIRQCWGWGEMQMFLNENDQIIITSLSLLKN